MKGLGNVIMSMFECLGSAKSVFAKMKYLVKKKVNLSFALAQNKRVTARYPGELLLLTSLTYKHIPFSVIYSTSVPLFLFNCYYQSLSISSAQTRAIHISDNLPTRKTNFKIFDHKSCPQLLQR